MAELLAKQVQKRVIRLEELMAQLIVTVDRTNREVAQLSMEMRDFKAEMRDFKDEMRDFKDEMHDFKDEMRDFKDEMHDFKDEMQASQRRFEQQMRISQERSDQQMEEFRRNLAENDRKMKKETERFMRKMGTLAEDMVAPSIPTILRRILNCSPKDIEFLAVRVKRLHPVTRKQREYDVVAVCGDYLCINETKSRVSPRNFAKFAEKSLPKAREFFPEYAAKKIIGLIASFHVDESLVRYGERMGLVVLGFGQDMMEVLNQPGFIPRCF